MIHLVNKCSSALATSVVRIVREWVQNPDMSEGVSALTRIVRNLDGTAKKASFWTTPRSISLGLGRTRSSRSAVNRPLWDGNTRTIVILAENILTSNDLYAKWSARRPLMSTPDSSIEGRQIDAEVQALSTISTLLGELPEDSQARIVTWISSRYGAPAPIIGPPKNLDGPNVANPMKEFPDVASLFVAAKPSTGSEKALIIGYWLQEYLHHEEWEGFAVNSELKHLGHGLKNVTDALRALIEQRPQLAVQLRKSGKTKQARKRYKLTGEGVRKVRQILSSGTDS